MNTVEPGMTIYTPITCYKCKRTMGAYYLKSIWPMKIDGCLHDVPVRAQCFRCEACNITVLGNSADPDIAFAREEYMKFAKLNTPYKKVRRWVRQRIQRVLTWLPE